MLLDTYVVVPMGLICTVGGLGIVVCPFRRVWPAWIMIRSTETQLSVCIITSNDNAIPNSLLCVQRKSTQTEEANPKV